MNSYAPGSTYYGAFTTHSPATGVAANADSTPIATANVNGTDDAGFALTVTNLDAGRYSISGTVPNGYTAGDRVQIFVTATKDGNTDKGLVDVFTVSQVREIIEALTEYSVDHWRFKSSAVENVFLVDMADVQAAAGRNTLCAIVLGAFHFHVVDGTWTVYRTDDATVFTTWATTVDTHTTPVVGVHTPV